MHNDLINEMGNRGMSLIVIDKVHYFSVEELKEKAPDMKITRTEEVKPFKDTNGKDIHVIKAEYIEPMTEWDKKIKQSLMFNPNKK